MMRYACVAFAALAGVLLAVALLEVVPPFADRCDAADPACPDAHFQRSYLAARHRFRSAVTAAGGSYISTVIAHDHELAEPLTIDVALFPGSDPSAMFIHMSGTHGPEGYVGSAVQSKLLASMTGGKAQGPSRLFIHAVNPYGFHFNRRVNENNVDLNRNFIFSNDEWSAALERPPNAFGYEGLADSFNPECGISEWWHYFAKLPWYILRPLLDIPATKAAAVSGQYHIPRGIFYGGQRRERSTEALKKIVDRYVNNASEVKRVIVADVHSGLGRAGSDELLVFDVAARDEARRLMPAHADRIELPGGTGVSSGYSGAMGLINFAVIARPGVRVLHVAQEFGTRPGPVVLWGLVAENAAYHCMHANSRAREFIGQKLRDAFFVDTHAWKADVLERGVVLAQSAIDALAQPWSTVH